MSFFSSRPEGRPQHDDELESVDPIILEAGKLADEAMLDCLTETGAYWATYRRWQTENRDRQIPGYRDELNRRRAAAGLPRI